MARPKAAAITPPTPTGGDTPKPKSKTSLAARKRIAAAQKKRWALHRQQKELGMAPGNRTPAIEGLSLPFLYQSLHNFQGQLQTTEAFIAECKGSITHLTNIGQGRELPMGAVSLPFLNRSLELLQVQHGTFTTFIEEAKRSIAKVEALTATPAPELSRAAGA